MSEEQQWKDLVQLKRILAKRFDTEELKTLCFDLQVKYDDLPGEGKSNKARELLTHLARRNRIPDLLDVGGEQRPDIDWPEISWKDSPEAVDNEELLTHLHEERAHTLSELYGQIVDVEDDLRAWAYKDMPVGIPPEVEPAEVMAQVRELDRLARKARIYLSGETLEVGEGAVKELGMTAGELERREIMPDGDERWSAHVAAVDRLFDTVPPAVERLEGQIRLVLGGG
jgi:hypothetical protein